ncbi:hypothetical protein [Pseudomonas sp. 273]|uniref:hypothetical protein n=1 Tax=Pseudomonas sp. 273 TaxID=75692 RepID=UPI0023D844A9|nr:hypothetical protein [Pseudomonas sp. 273]
MPELKPHSWAQSGNPTSTILNRIREHNIEFGGSPARVAHSYDVPLYKIPADQVLVPIELLKRLQDHIEYDAIGSPSASIASDLADELRALLQP